MITNINKYQYFSIKFFKSSRKISIPLKKIKPTTLSVEKRSIILKN